MNIKTLKMKVTNLYLVPAGTKYLLVDTGYEYERELFVKELAAAVVRLDEIGFVLLTHHHDDHAGLLAQLAEANPSLKVIVSLRGRALLASGKHYHTPGAGYINRPIGLLLALKGRFDKGWTHSFPPYTARQSDLLIDGETRFEALGIQLPGRIIPTPGHSPDHISVVFDDGDCLAGDAAANFLQWAGAAFCVISVDDLEAYYASWQKLIAAGARRIFPSHGLPFGVEALRQNMGRHKKENMVPFATG
jgi:glyoxylase-like metal-dependent hydrolase (beta-lactamase superfamily II)